MRLLILISFLILSVSALASENDEYWIIDHNNSSMTFDGMSFGRASMQYFSNSATDEDWLGWLMQDVENRSCELLNGAESGAFTIGAYIAHEAGFRGAGQTIAVWDSGFNNGRRNSIPDLSGRVKKILYRGAQLAFIENANDPDFFETHMLQDMLGNPLPPPGSDLNGHGTHVAGTIAMNGASSEVDNFPRAIGIAPESNLVIYPLTDSSMPPLLEATNRLFLPKKEKVLRNELRRAKRAGARIFNNSWGATTQGRYRLIDKWLDQWAYENPDVSLVFAAGNTGRTDPRSRGDLGVSLGSPATAKNVISVGATYNEITSKNGRLLGVDTQIANRYSGKPNQSTTFSSLGPTLDIRVKPDISAPGSMILSLYSDPWPENSNFPRDPGWGAFNENFTFSGGTSMAAPIVSGAIALLREKLIKDGMKEEEIGSDLLRGILVNSATRFNLKRLPREETYRGRIDTRESLYAQGYGLISLEAAIGEGRTGHLFANQTVSKGKIIRIPFSIPEYAINPRVTLAWIDPAGESYKKNPRFLENDLDLTVRVGNESYFPLSAITINQYRNFYLRLSRFRNVEITKYFLGIIPYDASPMSPVEKFEHFERRYPKTKRLYPHELKDFTNNLEQIDLPENLHSNNIEIIIYGTDMSTRRQKFQVIVSYEN